MYMVFLFYLHYCNLRTSKVTLQRILSTIFYNLPFVLKYFVSMRRKIESWAEASVKKMDIKINNF